MKNWLNKPIVEIMQDGSKIKNYTNAWDSFYNIQPEYTNALAKKYPNIPIKDILSNSLKDKGFSNRNLETYAQDAISKYGDFNLNTHEMDSIANKTGVDIRNIESILSNYDSGISNKNINPSGSGVVSTKGEKEDVSNVFGIKFGPRMMLHRRYSAGSVPYKYLEENNDIASKQFGGKMKSIQPKMKIIPQSYNELNYINNKNINKDITIHKQGGLFNFQIPGTQSKPNYIYPEIKVKNNIKTYESKTSNPIRNEYKYFPSVSLESDEIYKQDIQDKLKQKIGEDIYDREYIKTIKPKKSIDISKKLNKKEIIDIQQKLVDSGININPKGTYKNNGVDGILGNATKKAVEEYNKEIGSFSYSKRKPEGEPCLEDQCAEYSQMELFRRSGLSNKINSDKFIVDLGLFGDAWKVSDHIINSGGSLIYNKGKSMDTPKVGDVVSMFTGGLSNYQDMSNKKGDGNTHTGFISKVNSDGSYEVEHNVHSGSNFSGYKGHAYTSLVKNNVLVDKGFKVNKITRPNYNKFDINNSNIIDPENILYYDDNNKSATDMVNFFNKNKKNISSILGLTDDQALSLAHASLGIINQETKFGEVGKIKLKGKEILAESIKRVTSLLSKDKEYGKNSEASKGLGRVKREMNFGDKNYTRAFNAENLSEESFSEVITLLSKNFFRFKKTGITDEDALYRAIAAHNSPNKASNFSEDSYANNKNIDYVNKILVNLSKGGVKNKNISYNTLVNKLQMNPDILSMAKYVPSIQSAIKNYNKH